MLLLHAGRVQNGTGVAACVAACRWGSAPQGPVRRGLRGAVSLGLLRRLQPCVAAKLRRYRHSVGFGHASASLCVAFWRNLVPLRRYLRVAFAKLRRFLRRRCVALANRVAFLRRSASLMPDASL